MKVNLKERKKQERGITLVALVVTIVVLLILAGITISMVTNGGILESAKEAVGETKNAINKEQEVTDGRVKIDGMWYASIDDYLNNKPSQTAVYAKLYTDGTLILSSYDYTDETREVSEDYGDVSDLTEYQIVGGPGMEPHLEGEFPGWIEPYCLTRPISPVKNVIIYDKIVPKTTKYWFAKIINMEQIDLRNLDVRNVSNMEAMFYDCKNLTSLDVSGFDTSNATSMSEMFRGCSSLTNLDLSGFDTSNVTDMDLMFSYCSSLMNIYVSDKWTNGGVTSGRMMFTSCEKLRGAISYASGKTDVTYANYSTGYFTYKEAPMIKNNL